MFGGIAGIMTSEQGEHDDLGHMPSMSSKTRELGELQDMYRKTLAASWTCNKDEMPADECIENIFAGGDGWRHGEPNSGNSLPLPTVKRSEDSTEDAESDGDSRRLPGHMRRPSGHRHHTNDKHRSHTRTSSKTEEVYNNTEAVSGRTSIEQQVHLSQSGKKKKSHRRTYEVDEIEAREDLRSWEISIRS